MLAAALSALLADAAPPAAALSLVERYGSFGLLVVLILGFAFWVIPAALARFKEITTTYSADLKAERESREAQHKECEATHRKTAEILSDLTAQIERMANRTDEHRPHEARRK